MKKRDYSGNFQCVCGREYTNSQAFKGHQSQCKVYLESKGIDVTQYQQQRRAKELYTKSQSKEYIEEQKILKKKLKLEAWVNENHTCEKCGKVMTEKFGSGRFCSRTCANSHNHTDEARLKVAATLRGRALTESETNNILDKSKKISIKDKITYTGPELPTIQEENLQPGFFPRTRMSYAEKFWKQVLDNNNVSYQHDFIVQRPKGLQGVYRLDFLVSNIDIEIDGSQHQSDTVNEKDIRRDAYLNELGYIVYRIPWINPRNDINKQLVNIQIKNLFDILSVPRIY